MQDYIYLVWYSLICTARCKWAAQLLENYPGGIDGIYAHEFSEDEEYAGIPGRTLLRLNDKSLAAAEGVLMNCMNQDIRVIHCLSDEYPAKLKQIPDYPIVLYVKGNVGNLNNRLCVSVVGTRKMTQEGKMATFKIVRELSAFDPVIISGAALGIDCTANNSALYFGADTIAVLGSGLDILYPQENRALIERIFECGMVISEFPPGTRPEGRNFPVRNRIISGLCDALLVVEAPEGSGALITARCAFEQGKQIYAVPGSIFSLNSTGTNEMIHEGAKICRNGTDIIDDFAEQYHLTYSEYIVNSYNYRKYEGSFKPDLPKNTVRTQKTAAPEQPPQYGGGQIHDDGARSAGQQSPPENRANPAQKVENPAKPTEIQPEPPRNALNSEARETLRAKLGEKELKVFEAIPDGGVADADFLTSTGLSSSDVMSALTLLELCSAVESLPGGAYRKII